MLLPEIGREGQRRLAQSSVAVIGIGALGSVSADLLARAGVGKIRLIDRDFLELNNLQRQVLFDEEDLTNNLPKAVSAQRKLQRINSGIQIEAEPTDLNARTCEELLEGMDLILDGTDNFETRFLINDFCLREKKPWIYAGAVGLKGLTYVILPGEGPCLRCLFEEAPKTGGFETCDTAGILAPAAHIAASFQVTEAIKILVGKKDEVDRRLWKFCIWRKEFKAIDVGARQGDRAPTSRCSGCLKGEYPYLDRQKGSRTVSLCGRHAVQIIRDEEERLNFQNLAQRLSPLGRVRYNDFLLKASISPFEITVFQNGRAIIQGTDDPAEAKSVYARYIGG